ncbi:MAG: DUF4157 domain-containing protein, partial [Holophagales bacterium]|nr:DUF4157 domain-containing protein [Holophagales bacterium]
MTDLGKRRLRQRARKREARAPVVRLDAGLSSRHSRVPRTPASAAVLGPAYGSGPAYGLGQQPSSSAPREPTSAAVETARRAISSSENGRPIDPALRRRIEGSLGRDFSHVRVHTGASARAASRALGARAFTHRHHIFLGRRESPNDARLLAHELTHVAQQGAAAE